ncbi:hypothetical protein TRVL_08077 [Trypanosoma vivax]|nr:hypothetical protein TRVL_08077 [Trypanosoma vivax]
MEGRKREVKGKKRSRVDSRGTTRGHVTAEDKRRNPRATRRGHINREMKEKRGKHENTLSNEEGKDKRSAMFEEPFFIGCESCWALVARGQRSAEEGHEGGKQERGTGLEKAKNERAEEEMVRRKRKGKKEMWHVLRVQLP